MFTQFISILSYIHTPYYLLPESLFLPVSLCTHTFRHKHMIFETLLILNPLWSSISKYISMCLLTILHLTEYIYFPSYHFVIWTINVPYSIFPSVIGLKFGISWYTVMLTEIKGSLEPDVKCSNVVCRKRLLLLHHQ